MTHRAARSIVLAAGFVLAASAAAVAQESVRITLPQTITFTASTTGTVTASTNPSVITFDDALLLVGRVLRISVKADGPGVMGPDGASFAVSLVSWAASNTSGGAASPGTLSGATYTQVFQSNPLTIAGGFDIDWRLASVAGVTRAGTYTITVRWNIEAVFP